MTRDDPTLRFLCYNVRHGQGVASLPSNRRTARVINSIDPVVAGLTEVWRVGTLFDQPTSLGALTDMSGAYHSAHASFAGETGNLILTKGIVHSVEELGLGGRREKRGCLVADIEAGGARFAFAVTHLSLHGHTRREQIEALAGRLPRDRPLVIVGDFNCERADLTPLEAFLTFPNEPPATFHSLVPFRRLDHIGCSEHWELEGLRAVPSAASDHLPLVAEIRFNG